MAVCFADGQIKVTGEEPRAEFAEHMGGKDRMKQQLKEWGQTTTEALADEVDLKLSTAKSYMTDLVRQGVAVPMDEKIGKATGDETNTKVLLLKKGR